MGDYTNISTVRDLTGYQSRTAPSGTVNFCINLGESTLKKYLNITPDSASATGSNYWVRGVATYMAAHYLCMRLATQNAPSTQYARGGTRRTRDAEWGGYSIVAEQWWDKALQLMNMHGRDIIVERVEP